LNSIPIQFLSLSIYLNILNLSFYSLINSTYRNTPLQTEDTFMNVLLCSFSSFGFNLVLDFKLKFAGSCKEICNLMGVMMRVTNSRELRHQTSIQLINSA
jgi:hypothetical protein